MRGADAMLGDAWGRRGRSRWASAARALAVLVAIAAVAGMPVMPTARAAVLVTDAPVASWQVDGVTHAIRVVGGVTFVGGSFSTATAPDGSTRPRANLAAFDSRTGALIEGFRADTNGAVRALVSDGSTLWVGGSYTTIAGVNRSRVAALDVGTGAVRAFQANTNSNVYGLDLRAGRLFLGGSFSNVRGTARNRAAAVDPVSGVVDGQWNPNANNTVVAVRANPTASTVYLAGSFTAVGGASRSGVAGVTGTTGAAATPVLRNTYRPTLALDMDESGSRLFAAVGGAGNQAAAWDTATGVRVWAQYADGDVQAVAYHAGTVYFGFHESYEDDTTLRLLAATASTGTLEPGFRPTWDRYWGVYALSVADDVVAVAGDFTRVSDVAVRGIALFRPPDTTPEPTTTTTTTTTTAPSTTTTTAPTGPIDHLGPSTPWRFLDTGAVPGAGWRTAGYADGSWRVGPPQLGYGDGDEATTVSYGSDPNNKPMTTYFRAAFDAIAAPTTATIYLVADDGAVVYVNGVEAVRDNMPAGTISPWTRAATGRSGSGENVSRSFTIDPALIIAGTNTIAVEVHQDHRTSSDLSFDLRLSSTG